MNARTFLIALVALPVLCYADHSLKSQIEAMHGPIAKAMMKRDVKSFAKIVKGSVTPDFQYSDDGGQPMNFDKMVEGMKMGLSMWTKVTKATAELVSVK